MYTWSFVRYVCTIRRAGRKNVQFKRVCECIGFFDLAWSVMHPKSTMGALVVVMVWHETRSVHFEFEEVGCMCVSSQ